MRARGRRRDGKRQKRDSSYLEARNVPGGVALPLRVVESLRKADRLLAEATTAPLAFSPQPIRHPNCERCLPRKPLRLRRWRLKRLKRTGLRGCDLQGHLAGMDRPDLLTRYIANLSGLLRLDCKAVENVVLLISLDLRNRANDDAIGGDYVPSLLNLQPRDRISHRWPR